MRPKTKLQKAVMENARLLPPLSESQRQEAIQKVAPHIAKLNSKGVYTCMDCGHSWKGEKAKHAICPHCSTKLTVETDRKQKEHYMDYFMVVTTCNGFQVLRMFLMDTRLCKGKPANWWIGEAFQRWITPDGKETIVSRARNFMARCCDSWNWSSDLEIRKELCSSHFIHPYKIIGRKSIIPELTRNGLKGSFHGCNPHCLVKLLLTDNQVETLWKVGQFELVKHFSMSSYRSEKYWPSVKIAMRHHYMVKDASLWFDLLYSLSHFNKDIRNPKLICPANLKKEHDYWQHKIAVQRERERRQWEIEHRFNFEQQYLSNTKIVAIDNEIYQKAKSKFFDLKFCDKELTIKPLTTIEEFVQEGRLMCNCVFTSKYYERDKSLILHALVNGASVATIEINLENLQVLQCRGVHNSVSPLQNRILSLIEANKGKIAQRLTA